jgi:Tol biopolymer transport system component
LETDVLADYGSPTIIVNKSINTGYYEGAATITDTIIIDQEQETFRQTMIFVSDRNAEKTLTDLFTVEKLNGQWQTAKALPSFINTPGQETTPFLTPDGRFLFFSSDAMPGMGGYDIYYCEWVNNEWSKPVNLGATFNTVNDDTHFQIYPEWKKAMMAGIRENEGVFNYDLFEINLEGLDFPFLK